MTIPDVPLPGLADLLRATKEVPCSFGAWGDAKGAVHAFGRGSFAFSAALTTVLRDTRAEQITVWVPGYFCDETLLSARQLRVVDIRFYSICPNLQPDWSELAGAVTRVPMPQVFLLVHYFGFPNHTQEATQFCERYGILLFEDCAHVLQHTPGIGQAEWQFFSPWKLLAVPKIGLLVAPGRLLGLIPKAEPSSGSRLWAWLAKCLIQSALTKLHVPWHLIRPVDREHQPTPETSGVSSYGVRLLGVMERSLALVRQRRVRNYTQLVAQLSGAFALEILSPPIEEGICPYALPVRVRGGCHATVRNLRSRGLPASTWPNLPQKVLESPAQHAEAIRRYQEVMLISVHQNLDSGHIDRIARALRESQRAHWR